METKGENDDTIKACLSHRMSLLKLCQALLGWMNHRSKPFYFLLEMGTHCDIWHNEMTLE